MDGQNLDGQKKIAALVILAFVVLSLIPATVQPLTYRNVDWVRLGYRVYYGEPTPTAAVLPPVYLPRADRR